MMGFLLSLLIIICLQEAQAVIYYLNDTEYDRMPAIYHLDKFDIKLQEFGHTYCMIDFDLAFDPTSDLYKTIQEYSEHYVSHFNHTKLRYGIDVLKTCKKIKNKDAVSKRTLEACLNETFKRDYKLGVHVKDLNCNHDGNNTFDIGDVIMAITLLAIVSMNVAGTIFDAFSSSEKVGHFLLCFSLRRNWNKLITPIGGPDSRLDIFQGLNGIKYSIVSMDSSMLVTTASSFYYRILSCSSTLVTCTMNLFRVIVLVGVVAAHSMWPFLLLVTHARDIELSYYDPMQYFLFNGTLAIQTYFVLTGLLMSYKMLLYLETEEPNWRIIFKGIFLRWLRLTPSYVVVLAMMATFVRFIRHGPQWELAAGQDVVDCRGRWWLNLFYINNYVYNAQCMPHSWYIAADFQLCCIGMTVMILTQRVGFKNIILSLLFMVGIIIAAIQTYIYNLDGVLITSPGATRTFFAMDPTFNEAYKTGHSNLSSFVIGIALGHVIYYIRERNFDIESYKKYRFVYWVVAPLTFIYILSGYVFYRDAPRASLSVRVITAVIAKPLFGVLIAIIIAGLSLRVENFYRSILEWKIWIVPGRLSYCIYILHLSFIRIFAGTKTGLIEASKYNFFALMFSVLAISFAMAIPLWLFLESPFYELIKRSPKKSTNAKDYRTHL